MQLVYKGKNRISYSAFANRESSLELAAGSDPRENHWLVPLLKRNLVFCYTRLRNEAVVPASTSLTFSKTQYDLVEAALETKNPHHLLWGFEKATLRKAPSSHSSPAIATHFCRRRYPQLRVDVVPFVGNGLSLCGEPFFFLPRSDQTTRAAIHSVAAKPVGRNGDGDLPVGCLRCGKFLHLISFGRLGMHPEVREYS